MLLKTAPSHPPLIWLDMEMSGLDPESCVVLEIATIVTDGDLQVLAEGPDIVVSQPKAALDAMDAWCTEHHGQSGLTAEVLASKIDLEAAQAQTLAFLERYCEAGKSPLCGNSIGQDRRFIERYMPQLARFLHYRSIDVSSVKEIARRWYPDLVPYQKAEGHRALADIQESIAELSYYREQIFVKPPSAS